MGRVTGLPITDGMARSSSDLNALYTAIVAQSAQLNGVNFAEEGLDIRNLNTRTLSYVEKTGNRPCYIERTTATAFAAGGDFRAEAAAAASLGGAVELDWSGDVFTPSSDEVLIIQGIVGFGVPQAFGCASGGVGAHGVSAAICVDPNDGGGYDLIGISRQSWQGVNYSGAVVNTLQIDSFALCPMFVVTTGSVKKICITIGTTAAVTVNAVAAQLHATIYRKAR